MPLKVVPEMAYTLEKTLSDILVSTRKTMRQKTDSFGIWCLQDPKRN